MVTLGAPRPAVFGALDWSRARPGVRLAIQVIVERVASGEKTTAICVPTRYGKSDIFRIATFLCRQARYAAVGLVLSPNCLLQGQAIEERRVRQTLARYQVDAPYLVASFKTLENPWTNDEMLLSATIQFVQRNVDIIADWVRFVVTTTGLPPIIFIDEAHMTSDKNSWGRCVETLVAAGAHVVLLTATPYRARSERIPGFDYDVVDSEATREYVRREDDDGAVWVDVYESTAELVRLRADHYTTFREAWDEVPAPLCKVGPVRFDVELRELGPEYWHSALSLKGLPQSEARRVLHRLMRHPNAMQALATRIVDQLAIYRRIAPDVGAIVYSGNDEDPTMEANKHAREIAERIERLAPHLDVVIATSADLDAERDTGVRRIRDFTERGRGDILIVKQMAGVGLDCERLKVGADGSPVRAPASYVQRVMRVGTPYGDLLHAVWICPDEESGRRLWQRIITDQGGESHISRGELVASYQPKDGPPRERREYFIGAVRDGDFEDSHFHRGIAQDFAGVRALALEFPPIIEGSTYAEVAERLRARGLSISVCAEVADASRTAPLVRNMDAENDALYTEIEGLVGEIAKMRLRASGKPYDGAFYGKLCSDVWVAAKTNCGLPQVDYRKITCHEDLVRLRANVQAIRDADNERLSTQQGTDVCRPSL